jgi:hypothetical protein
MKFSLSSKYYFMSIVLGLLSWVILLLVKIDFINIIFFNLAFIWHFALMAPEMKEHAIRGKSKYSLMSLVYKSNFYLQMFIRFNKIKYTSSIVRAISPFLFTFFLLIVGGSGNLLFTLLGSFIFEVFYLKLFIKIKDHVDDLEIPPVIPSEEKSPE